LAVQNAYWAIGSHNYRPYPRYFKGRIFYAAVYNSALANFAELDTDSDNNGYIGQITINPENARYEDGLKLTNPKPITYIDSTKAAGASIPDDYIRVPLRVMYLTDDRNAEFCFASSNGVKVIKSDGTDAETAWTDISSLNISTVSMAAGKEGTFVDNYYAVATSKTNPETTLDVSLQIKRNGTTISDTVKFLWQEAPTVASPQGQKYEWIVPSGWKISGNTFTTPITPYEAPIPPATVRYTKAVGPKTEGSGVITNSGDIISVVSYDNGFVMELDFAFIRNTSMRNISDAFIEGYIQPTFNVNGMENERVDIQKRHQMDFVGNSGIKFFNNEVQIFDIIALQNSINLTSEDDVDPQTYKINPKTVDGINYGVEDGAATDRRTKVGNTITGNAYDNTEVNFRTYADFMVAYNRQIPGVDVNIHLFIDITKIGNSLTILTKVKNRQGVLENVYNGPNVKELTGGSTYVRIQSHWGSGVRISNISISAK
ncbi:MAG: hypothetical protein LBJ00_11475, partial [Planctomycetaceae bacterium]|nr:hypothetical protein [Planctomycetaceae bacterium]